jgi:hypothetical protein
MISDTMVLWRTGNGAFGLTGWGYIMILTVGWLIHWVVRGDE